jgi:hypothetical protein
MTGKSPNEIIEEMKSVADVVEAPAELQARLMEFADRRRPRLADFRLGALALAACFLDTGEKAGEDRELLDRICAGELMLAAALVVRAMKERQGEEFSSARFAFVAYNMAELQGQLIAYSKDAADAQKMADDTPAADPGAIPMTDQIMFAQLVERYGLTRLINLVEAETSGDPDEDAGK